MLILFAVLAVLIAADLCFRRLPVRKPVIWIRLGTDKPKKRVYTLRHGFCHVSRHSEATLQYEPKERVFHILQNGEDTILRKGTCISLMDSGECILGSRHPRRLTMTVLFLCGLLVFRLVFVPVIWNSLVSPAYDKIEIQQADYHWVSDDDLTQEETKSEKQLINILLLGTDGRNSLEPRSDVMMLVSFNNMTRTVSFVSLLRDYRIMAYDPYSISLKDFHVSEGDPNYAIYEQMTKNSSEWLSMKLGETFTLNKGSLSETRYLESCRSAALNVEQVFHIRIDGFIAVDFESVKELVDAIGGVEVNIKNQEYVDAMNDVLKSQNELFGTADHIDSTGVQKLNGNMSLAYLRLRHVGNWSDVERTNRQRALLIQICKQGLANAFSIDREQFSEAFKNVITDISERDAYRIYKLFLTGMYTVKSNSLPYQWDDCEVQTREGTEISYIYIPSWYLPLEDQVREVIYQNKEE